MLVSLSAPARKEQRVRHLQIRVCELKRDLSDTRQDLEMLSSGCKAATDSDCEAAQSSGKRVRLDAGSV